MDHMALKGVPDPLSIARAACCRCGRGRHAAAILGLIERTFCIAMPMPFSFASCAKAAGLRQSQLFLGDLLEIGSVRAPCLSQVSVLCLRGLVGHVGLVELLGHLLRHRRIVIVALLVIVVAIGEVVVLAKVSVEDIPGPVLPPLAFVVLASALASVLPGLPEGPVLNDGSPLEKT